MKPHELIKALMQQQKLGSLPLARRLGKPKLQSTIHRFKEGKVASPERSTAEPLAAFFGIPTDAIYDEKLATAIAVERGIVDTQPSREILTTENNVALNHVPAHPLSLQAAKVPPQSIQWEDLMKADLSGVFEVELVDDAMAPELPAGTVVRMDTDRKPSYGKHVLIRDGSGTFHFRKYAQALSDEWEGKARNDAFRDIRPGRDGAKVIAVMRGYYVEEK